MSEYKSGDRVKTIGLDRDAYAQGAAEALSNKTGTVAPTDRPHSEGKILVRFDEPASTWWAHQTPAESFWFDASELRRVQ